MKYNRLLDSIKYINNGVSPDTDFLKSLSPVNANSLSELEIPNEIKQFLTNIGLPKEVCFAREPEEMEEKDLYKISFPLEKFYIKNIEGAIYLCIGGRKGIDKSYIHNSEGTLIEEYEHVYTSEYLVCISTGEVWYVNDSDLKWDGEIWRMADIDLEMQFINSSIEQFILSVACWRAFYPQFEQKYLEVDGDLGYIFDHNEIYDTFLNTMQILDSKAVEYEFNYWWYMCDLSLY